MQPNFKIKADSIGATNQIVKELTKAALQTAKLRERLSFARLHHSIGDPGVNSPRSKMICCFKVFPERPLWQLRAE